MTYDRQAVNRIINAGSQTYEYICGVLGAGVTLWLHMEDLFPQARIFIPFDSLELINNSAQNLTLYIGSITEAQTVPSYMIKPIARRPFSQLGIMNQGAADTVAGEIILHVKRLPPNVQVVMTAGNTVR
jgi:hypothetical protein